MNKKRITALTLFLIFIVGALSGLSMTVSAAERDNAAVGSREAVIKLYNNDELTDTLTCSVGHIITVSTLLDTSAIDDGKISGIEGYQTFTPDSLSLTDELDEEGIIEDKVSVFPLMSENVMGHLDEDGLLFFAAFSLSTSKPFIFDGSDGRLIVTRYKVTSAGESEIRTSLRTLAKNDRLLTKIIDRGVVKDGYSFDFSSHTDSHTLSHVDAVAPTASADGSSEYWICDSCSAMFADENGETPVTAEDIVIRHQQMIANSISLKDEIGINYYIYIPDCYSTDLSAEFTWGYGSYNKEFTAVPVSTSSYGANFKVSCPVSARSMTDTVHMSLTYNGTEILTYDYSIADYTESASAVYSDREDLKDLLCYMLEYGASVQRYFNYKTTGDAPDVADSYISNIYSDEVWAARKAEAPSSIEDVTDINSFDFTADYGMDFYATSLSTTSKTVIRLYFSVTDSDKFESTAAETGGKTLPFLNDTSGRYKYIEISGISAKKIFDPYTITFTNGTNSTDRVYSAANYYNYMLNQNTDAKTQAILRAMYNYSASATGVLSTS